MLYKCLNISEYFCVNWVQLHIEQWFKFFYEQHFVDQTVKFILALIHDGEIICNEWFFNSVLLLDTDMY